MSDQSATRAALSATGELPNHTFFHLLEKRGSCRDFKSDPLPEGWVEAIIAAGQRAPSSSNHQVYSIIVVRDPETKAKFAKIAGDQQHIIDCPVFFALCADQTVAEYAAQLHGMDFVGNTLEKGLVAAVDVALVGMTMSLAADALGLGSVMIGAMRNDPLEVARILKLPPKVFVVFGLCIGWPRSAPIPKPRLPMEAIVHQEVWGNANRDQAVAAYDQELARHYRDQGRDTPDAAWSYTTAEKYNLKRRLELRQQLTRLGFPME